MTNKMKCKIIIYHYSEKNEKKVEKLLDSVCHEEFNKKLFNIGEATIPYSGEEDQYIDDIIDLLLSHSENQEMIKIISKTKKYLPKLIIKFNILLEEYRTGEN